MQLVYGGYRFNANECKIATASTAIFSEAKIPMGFTTRVTVNGYLTGDGQLALTAESLIFQQYMVHYQDLILLRDDGGLSATLLLNAGSRDGVKIVDGPRFEGTIAEYATQRAFQFTLEASYIDPNPNLVIAFSETFAFSGGGPEYVFKRAVNALPQKQVGWPATEYMLTVTGQVTALNQYVPMPSVILPQHLMRAPQFAFTSPQRQGLGFMNFQTVYTQEYAAVSQMVVTPRLWYPGAP